MYPIETVLRQLEGVEQRNGYWMARCPAHDDSEPSLSVSAADDGRVLLKCHAGCSVEAIVQACGLKMGDLFKRRGGGVHDPRDAVGTVVRLFDGPGLTLDQYAEAKALPHRFLAALGVTEIPNYNGHPAVRIPYMTRDGEEVCVRFRVSLDGHPKIKTRKGDKHALYGLWRPWPADEDSYVWVVEGESDAQTLWGHAETAVGVPGAASWQNDWAKELDGIGRIYVMVEPDQGGEQLWDRLAASPLRERLYKVELPGYKDVSEMHLDTTRKQFADLLLRARERALSYTELAIYEADQERRDSWEQCERLARDDDILERLRENLEASGVTGEAKLTKLLYLAATSRLLEKIVSIAVKGPSAGGKSYITEQVLLRFPDRAYYGLTSMSERGLAYDEEPLKHRMLVIYEASGMEGDMQTYLIRSLLSEGRLRYLTLEKTKDGIKPRVIEREGPTGLIVTTTATRLHSENETRLLSLTVTDTEQQTADVMAMLADEDVEEPDLEPWHALQTWLEHGLNLVTIPYSKLLSRMIPPKAVRLRRDFAAILSLIKAHALLHQATRERDEKGRIVATTEDYARVRELVVDLVSEGVEATVPQIVRETVNTVAQLLEETDDSYAIASQVRDELKLDRNAVGRRLKLATDAGYLKNLVAGQRGKTAQYVIGEPMPEDLQILPTAEELAAKLAANRTTVPIASEGVENPPPSLPTPTTM